jgi:2-dehydro-3-deoxy-L-rhamnonate dehydrogenase (NAD+)
MIEKRSLGRVGEPGEIAECVAFRVSERCCFNTGAVFDLSGGHATD